ncbi:adenine/guanine phosphoribosyltransferase-like PRPP-binding protein [Kitasatospora sp. MAA4]|uniref:phosphoribosyltransferase n=1 Tax=Kitasatospora sp. MAA4 TaxID=3035093 RepID=UPI002477209D|nr:phosphoribosyltransferase [Kitasatospora sp. MAA4]MDH6131798.1 adenine/guanine phosphoribosyltransferase-like PRPP-binding protein [Kitasatospora sp. MAA4]
MEETAWSGQWVTDRLGIGLTGSPELPDLLGLAVRQNAKRAHLLVSQVLGKHVPQRPAVVYDAGRRLGELVRAALGPAEAGRAVVLGYAETATGLGHCVADALGADYLHSTRRPVPGVAAAAGFEEEHSHATAHLLLPSDPELLGGDGPLVVVDDELSTGRTVLNTIAALHRRRRRERYVIASLVDLRGEEDRARMAEFAASLGARVEAVALAEGRVRLPEGTLERAQRLVASTLSESLDAVAAGSAGDLVRVELPWPAGLPDGGRHGFTAAHAAELASTLPGLAARLAGALCGGERRVLVLGFEELMYVPLRLAGALADVLGESAEVRYSTTTRSPVLAVDDPGYAIRTRLAFPAHDDPADGPGERYAYNVAPGRDRARRFDAVVLVLDGPADTPALAGLSSQLREVTDRVVLAVLPSHVPSTKVSLPMSTTDLPTLPRPLYGPAFSSYASEEVGWLLTDLSEVALEAPTEEREEAVQSGGAHYAESLPVEYQPSPEYQELFHQALRGSARRIALAVGTVAETLVRERGSGVGRQLVLASLARAGTPIGILLRRWLAASHRIEVPHYAVSIVRGRGIDPVALRYLASQHDPAGVVFVDGWTGKGAITRELAAALEGTPFDPELAVLADPARCVRTYGTRDDFLIPSACLNSTVSGLVSRTVLREDLIGPDDFHGAKHYGELAAADVSHAFLDTVEDHFEAVREAASTAALLLSSEDRTPSWEGWAAVQRISTEYGIDNVNLVKPGVGETTRVMLRRVPWRVLARRGAGSDLDHVRLLAAQRGVPVEEVDDLPYSCVGLIHPRYNRGAVGEHGQGV